MTVLGGLLGVVWGAFVAATLLAARSDMRAGRVQVDALRGATGLVAVSDGRLLPGLGRARARFSEASDQLRSPLLGPLRFMPVAGRQLRSVSSIASASELVVTEGIEGLAEAQAVLHVAVEEPLPARIGALRGLAEIAASVDDRLRRVELGPRTGLLPPLARARRDLAGGLEEIRAGLQRGASGVSALADVLAGPHRYLVLAANNAEMRAGSGTFLSVAELHAGPEGLRLGELRPVTDVPVPSGAVALDADLADRWGWLGPIRDWRDLMTSPRFDVAGGLAAQLWAAAGNQPVEGVVAVDPVTYRGLLAVTGPVQVDGRSIRSADVVDELLQGQFVRGSDGRATDQVAVALVEALNSRNWSVAGLIDALAEAASGRHLLLWSPHAAAQARWHALAMDGSLRADSLAVSVLNRGGNKLDRFLAVKAQLDFQAAGADTQVTVRVELRNTAGPEPESGVGEGVYAGILAVTVPGTASDAHFDGVQELAVAGADGPTRVVAVQLRLARGESRVAVARFRLPGHAGVLRVEPSARVPALEWSSGPTQWADRLTTLQFQAGQPAKRKH